MDYLFKTSLLLALFYFAYRLFLIRDTLFDSHRIFLLAGLILSLIIPLVIIPNYVEYESNQIWVNTNDISNHTATAEKATYFDWLSYIQSIYFIGVTFVMLKFLVQLFSLLKMIRIHPKEKIDGLVYIKTEDDISPFSFFNFIIFNPKHFSSSELDIILTHEKIHVKEYHTWDILMLEIACAFWWFNPLIWFYRKSLKQNLEFIADKKASTITNCSVGYSHVILKTGIPAYGISLGNNFFSSLIKNRIVMLQQPKSNKINALKYLIIAPFLALFMMSFNTKTIYIEKPMINERISDTLEYWNVQKFVINKSDSDKKLEEIKSKLKKQNVEVEFSEIKRDENGYLTSIHVDFKTEKSNGNYHITESDDFKPISIEYDVTGKSIKIGNNSSQNLSTTIQMAPRRVKIPKNQDTIEDKQVRVNKQLNSNGNSNERSYSYSISNSNSDSNQNHIIIVDTANRVKVVRKENGQIIRIDSIVNSNEERIIRVGGAGQNAKVVVSGSGQNVFINKDGSEPLYIVDGKIIAKNKLGEINPNSIVSVNVWKGEKATKLYGTSGQNGVIVINSKDSKDDQNQFEYIVKKNGDKSRWQVDSGVSSVFLYNTDEENGRDIAILNKETPDHILDKSIIDLKKKGIDVNYSKLKRNKQGEIIRIKISLKDKNGKKSTATYTDDDGIGNVRFGRINDQLVIDSTN